MELNTWLQISANLLIIFLFYTFKSSFHEYIHFFFANKFKSCKALIISRYNIFRKNKSIKWVKNSRLQGGVTYVDNDFLDYTSIQTKIIAIAPTIAEFVVILGTSIMTALVLKNRFAPFIALFTVIYYCLTYVLGALRSAKRGTWHDFVIFLFPRKFKLYMMEQHQKILEESYQYNLKKAQKH